MKDGLPAYLPTLWISRKCKNFIEAISSWRWEEWVNPKDQIIKEAKNKPMMKWSHFPITLECIFKSPAFKPKRDILMQERRYHSHFVTMGR